MSYIMGIDLGTSSVKVLILNEDGDVLCISNRKYEIDVPQEGYAEQSPEMWWRSAVDAIVEAIDKANVPSQELKCIGISGQMHGAVLIDKLGHPIGPAIIHCDQRSKSQVKEIYNIIGKDEFHEVTKNPLFPGFQLASLLWIKQNELSSYEKAIAVLSPKDYLRLMLTGEVATEYSDASATLAFNMDKREWAYDIITSLDLDKTKFTSIYESTDIAGNVCKSAAEETGLYKGTMVIMGGADQPMHALGNGVLLPGTMISTIGTSGQVIMPTHFCELDNSLRTYTFCSIASDMYYKMGTILNAGLCLKWLNEKVLHYPDFTILDQMAMTVPPTSYGLLFLPYLVGERIPFGVQTLKGSFWGLTLKHDKAAMARAVMEGVTFALKERFEVINSYDRIGKVIGSGGGSNSDLWLQIQADVYNREIYRSNIREQACMGAAITAGVGVGVYRNFREACQAVVRIDNKPIVPIPENVKLYDEHYNRYIELTQRNSMNLKT